MTRSTPTLTTAEDRRLGEDAARTSYWKRWGPYLAERQWGTVREDYSASGSCWDYFPHDQARSRAYRWGEDGLLGICDRQCRLAFALALWNERDPILKERLFGLTGPEGNHGEDVKECYFYLDSTPTHSYLKALYKYPHAEFPYARLVEESRRRGKGDPELELLDTGVFQDGRYFDVLAEYAKAAPEDILVRITVSNRGPERARLHLLPTLWFRNTWSWGCTYEGCEVKPSITEEPEGALLARHPTLGVFRLSIDRAPDGLPPELLFTENETNTGRLFAHENGSTPAKDAFHEYVISGRKEALSPRRMGTKAAARHIIDLPAGAAAVVRLRLSLLAGAPMEPFGPEFEETFAARVRDADEFHDSRASPGLDEDQRRVLRQAHAGLLWSKQFYHYAVREWIEGDPEQPPPPPARAEGRNRDWGHLFTRDVISMPDKWEYPWFAAWDLAFHMIPFSSIDSHFAREQLVLFLREWYMHPNGQIPAYEFAFSDVNPPVHAWAAWRVYKKSGPRGHRDRAFLARVFQKLLINFTWWVNRKDIDGRHIFAGGFLGLDNIGVFDRSRPLPTGGTLSQADGTAWMAFYCTTMLAMAIELASEDRTYEDVASKFFEHFVAIADAMNTLGGTGLWDEEDGFYYDRLNLDGKCLPLRIRSMVGLIPLYAVEVLEDEVLERLPAFRKRMQWFLDHRQDLAQHVSYMSAMPHAGGSHGHRLLALPSRERLTRVLQHLLNEGEFLSDYGVRSVSRVHEARPYVFRHGPAEYQVRYTPGESDSGLFGGNSNWRGPIWFPVNFLLIEALERYHHFYGDALKVECPTGSGRRLNLAEVARELARRLSSIFLKRPDGVRPFQGAPINGNGHSFAGDPHWEDHILFHEYFHGDTGRGLGASHQTGWTALVAPLINELGRT